MAFWYSSDWGFRQKITIDSAMVPGDLTNFPVLVSVTSANLMVVPGGQVGKTNGGDILFTNTEGTVKYNHEVESYNSSTGELRAWVEIPAVWSTADTEFYMYYGNGGAVDQWNVNAVWDSNYQMVQHFHETSGTHFDSTSNGNNGTPQNGVIQNAAGQINGADDFDGSDDYVSTPSIALANGSFTVESWLKPDTSPPSQQCWFEAHKSFVATGGQSLHLRAYSNGRIRFGFYYDDLDTATGVVQFGEWNYIVVSYDNTTDTSRIYYNGFLNISGNAGPFIGASPVTISIGKWNTAPWQQHFKGIIDEVRVSTVERSADWIEASYNNQNNPSSFLSFSAQQVFTPAPTMTQWGMIIFMVLAGLGAFCSLWRLRRET